MRKKNFQFSSVELVFAAQECICSLHSFTEFASSCCKQFQSRFMNDTFLLRRYVSISHGNFSWWIKKAYLVWRFKDRTPVTDTVRTEVILTTFRRVIQCEKFIKDESASLVVYQGFYKKNLCYARYEKPLKKPLFGGGQKIYGNVFLISCSIIPRGKGN